MAEQLSRGVDYDPDAVTRPGSDSYIGPPTPPEPPRTKEILPREPVSIFTGSCVEGKDLPANCEDIVSIMDVGNYTFAIVCDGVGTGGAGRDAAQYSIELLNSRLLEITSHDPPLSHELTLSEINRIMKECSLEVFKKSKTHFRLQDMGSTATLVLIDRRGTENDEYPAYFGHLGDSRGYVKQPPAPIEAVTLDHSTYLNQLDEVAAREAQARMSNDPQAQRNYPMRHVLANHGAMGEQDAHPRTYLRMLRRGDRVLLASDGVTDQATEEILDRDLTRVTNPDETAQTIVRHSNEIESDEHHPLRGRKKPRRDDKASLVVVIGELDEAVAQQPESTPQESGPPTVAETPPQEPPAVLEPSTPPVPPEPTPSLEKQRKHEVTIGPLRFERMAPGSSLTLPPSVDHIIVNTSFMSPHIGHSVLVALGPKIEQSQGLNTRILDYAYVANARGIARRHGYEPGYVPLTLRAERIPKVWGKPVVRTAQLNIGRRETTMSDPEQQLDQKNPSEAGTYINDKGIVEGTIDAYHPYDTQSITVSINNEHGINLSTQGQDRESFYSIAPEVDSPDAIYTIAPEGGVHLSNDMLSHAAIHIHTTSGETFELRPTADGTLDVYDSSATLVARIQADLPHVYTQFGKDIPWDRNGTFSKEAHLGNFTSFFPKEVVIRKTRNGYLVQNPFVPVFHDGNALGENKDTRELKGRIQIETTPKQ